MGRSIRLVNAHRRSFGFQQASLWMDHLFVLGFDQWFRDPVDLAS